MTNEEAKAFLDNLKICIDEHPVVADWLVEIENRKTEPSNSEIPNNCDTCRHKGVEGCEQPCLGCGCCGLYEAMTENDKLKEKAVEFIKSCARCKHRPIGAMMCEESCHYEPKTEPQTEREGE